MQLSELLKFIPTVKVVGNSETEIRGIAYDSRVVGAGNLFVAIRGLTIDGHRFVINAIDSGAAGIVVEEDDFVDDDYIIQRGVAKIVVRNSRQSLALFADAFFGFPTKKLRLIGVTGTNGKTTTTYLIKSILEATGEIVGLIGTIDYKIGQESVPAERTTPESLELCELFSEMVAKGVTTIVMEVSSHALALDRVYGFDYDVAVFTNLTLDHLDFHKTFDEYFRAKKILFDRLKKKNAKAIYNVEDLFGKKIIADCSAEKISYGLLSGDVFATTFNLQLNKSDVAVQTNRGRLHIESNLIGRFNVYNILAAVAVGVNLGIENETIKKGIEQVQSVKGRFEQVVSLKGFTAVVDYSHTPDSLQKCLETIRDIVMQTNNGSKAKVITVFGCGGNRDRTKRPEMGRIATELSDVTIVTSDNPRSESPEAIIDEIMAGVTKGATVFREADRRAAIHKGLQIARRGDVVLIAGKGHEDYQEIKGVKYHFDDKEIVEEFIAAHV
jgi:UDP-N-acetylmuramoyl-L-alanyl-D-glutamate--2,6-diaminopimelate ligase